MERIINIQYSWSNFVGAFVFSFKNVTRYTLTAFSSGWDFKERKKQTREHTCTHVEEG